MLGGRTAPLGAHARLYYRLPLCAGFKITASAARPLLSLPLAYAAQFLPFSLGNVAPVLISVALGYLGLMVGLARYRDLMNLLPANRRARAEVAHSSYVLLDTSVVIDGRIADIDHRIADLLALRDNLRRVRADGEGLPPDKKCDDDCLCYIITTELQSGRVTIQREEKV